GSSNSSSPSLGVPQQRGQQWYLSSQGSSSHTHN
ncbi:unnamed protein product, partial [Brassica rapa subsp. trilocularis]